MQKFPRVCSSRAVISSQFVSETDFLAEVLRLEAISRFPTGGVLSCQRLQWRSLGGVECVNEKYGGINRFYGLCGILWFWRIIYGVPHLGRRENEMKQ